MWELLFGSVYFIGGIFGLCDLAVATAGLFAGPDDALSY